MFVDAGRKFPVAAVVGEPGVTECQYSIQDGGPVAADEGRGMRLTFIRLRGSMPWLDISARFQPAPPPNTAS